MIIIDSMGHLYSTENLKEIYNFAVNKMGLKAEWNHLGNMFPHWDLTTKKMKNKAIELGAQFSDVRNRSELTHYKQCQIWFKKMASEEVKNGNKEFFYECKGLIGQKIYRLNFNVLKHRIN